MSRLRTAAACALFASACVWLTACKDDVHDTQVIAVIDAEPAVRAQVQDVDFEVRSGQGPITDWTPRFGQNLTRGDAAPDWPLEVALVPRSGQTARNYLAIATARDAQGRAIAQVRAVSGYVDGKSLRLPLVFDAKCLERTTSCGEELTCRAGECVDAYVDPDTLAAFKHQPSQYDTPMKPGGKRDAGMHAMPDAGVSNAPDAGGGSGIGAVCEPGTPGCEMVEPTPAQECPDDACKGCPDGFVKDADDACTPLLTGLGLSSARLSPALKALTTEYAVDVPLLTDALVLTPDVADGVSIDIDGTRVDARQPYRIEALPIGTRTLVVTLSKSGTGARTYTIDVRRGGAQRAYLKASDGKSGDAFGRSLAISGDTIVVGAPGQDDGAMDSGAAYVFVRTDDSYAEQQVLKVGTPRSKAAFGTSVAIDGDTLAVGAETEIGGGAVYVFTRSGTQWTQQARLPHPAPADDQEFGHALVLHGDTLIVGASSDDTDRGDGGAVYVFTRSGDAWGTPVRVAPEAPQSAGWFGSSVALDGDTLAVGATGESTPDVFTSGAAYVFERSGSSFVQKQRVLSEVPGVGDLFGEAVALDGDALVVGALAGSAAESSSGVVSVYARNADTWDPKQQLSAVNAATGAYFGARVAMHGDVLVTGASLDDSGGHGVAGDPDAAMREASGAGYVFIRRGASFVQLTMLKADVPDPGDHYGSAVAFDGDTIVIGAEGESSASHVIDGDAVDNSATGSGAAYVIR